MKYRWLCRAWVVFAVLLSCNLPTMQAEPTRIGSVTVTPPVGEDVFSLEVQYSFTWSRDNRNEIIHCTYTTPGGSIIFIGAVVPEGLDRDREFFFKTDKLIFKIKPTDGKIEAGVYTAGCSTQSEHSAVTTTFTVAESAAPTVTSAPVVTPTAAPRPAFTPIVTPATASTAAPTPAPVAGKIVFDFANVDSSRPGAGGELQRVTALCIPEINITTAGVLSGRCEKPHIQALLNDESITVQVAGQVVASDQVTFSYDVSEIGTPYGAWRITYEGRGRMSSAAGAAGTAVFSFSCNSGAENLIWCWKWTSESFSGTIPWRLTP